MFFKKSFYSIFYIFLCSLSSYLSAQQQEQFSKLQIDVCYKIKKISPDAPVQEYKALAQELKNNNLSTCQCLRDVLLADKRRSAQKALEKEFNFPKELWQELEEFRKQNRPTTPLSLSFDPTIPTDTQDLIKKWIQEKNIKGKINIVLSKDVDEGETHYISNNSYEIRIYPMAVKNNSFLKAIFNHELKHIQEQHGYELLTIPWNCIVYAPLKSLLSGLFLISTPASIKKYYRLQEAEADRIPTACGTCNDAYNEEELNYAHYKFYKDRSFTPEQMNKIFGDEHPPFIKRLIWSVRISKLKEAEEQLLKDEKILVQKQATLLKKKKQKYATSLAYNAMNHFAA